MSAEESAATVPSADLPKLLDLGANKCVSCKKMAPILEALKQDYAGQFEVEFIDVWKNKAAGELYQPMGIPAQIFFDAQGKELYRHVGFYSRKQILEKWRELGYTFTSAANPTP